MLILIFWVVLFILDYINVGNINYQILKEGLDEAAKRNYSEILELLLHKQVRPSTDRLSFSLQLSDNKIVNILMSYPKDLLVDAVISNNIEQVKFILDYMNSNAVDKRVPDIRFKIGLEQSLKE